MGGLDFITQLRAFGYDVEERSGNRVVFPYTIPIGPRLGEQVHLGFVVPTDFPLSPPSGPYVSPLLLPINPNQSVGHPVGGVHPANSFGLDWGADWEYWSRPFPDWPGTDRTVRAYMAHIAHLFETL